MQKDRSAKLISLFFTAFVLLNFPIISILGNQKQFKGIPVLYLYFFLLWVAIIFFTYRIVERKE